jgi:TolA-binding protein
MQMARTMRKHFAAAAIVAAVLACAPAPAHAVSKEIVQLQTQVQQLLDMVQRLQSTLDSHFGVMQNLAQQTADQATQMNATVKDMQQKLTAQLETISGNQNTASGQIQSLNDSLDELRTRIDKLQKSVQDMQTQLQNIQTPPPTAMPGGETPGTNTGVPPNGQQQPNSGPPNADQQQNGPQQNGPPSGPDATNGQNGQPGGAPAELPATAQAPPLKQTYEAAVGDFNAARYKMAGSEFQQVVQYYPYDDLSGSAQFYLGEIDYQQHQYSKAVSTFNTMLENFPGNVHAPTAELYKGLSLLEMKRREDGIRELRLLVQRYPRTPEAMRARQKLDGMGVRIVPR